MRTLVLATALVLFSVGAGLGLPNGSFLVLFAELNHLICFFLPFALLKLNPQPIANFALTLPCDISNRAD